MKKTIFFISAMVALAIGTMLSSCNKDKEMVSGNGCDCAYYEAGTLVHSEFVSLDEPEWEAYGISDCEALADYFNDGDSDGDYGYKCNAKK